MRCMNPSCGQELEPGSLFCTFCGTQQAPEAALPSSQPDRLRAEEVSASATPVSSAPAARPETTAKVLSRGSTSEDALVMRAGHQVWDFTEDEGKVAPGKRRPTIVMDEQVTHLAHTDRALSMAELHRRVLAAMETYEVPVDVRLVKARWINDDKESRERIVASLQGHVFQDIKVIFGLDYMGRWANIHISIGMEPTPIEDQKKFVIPDYVKFTLIGAGVAIVLGSVIGQSMIALAGFAAAGFGIWRYVEEKKAHVAEIVAKQAMSEIKRAVERQSRTFKIDDMRLFCTAMKAVYQAVVDDIVESGAQVVRVEGGRGGFLSSSDNQEFRAPSTKLSDAADSEV